MELFGLLYIRCATKEHADRLRFYLDAKTRPDFPDEVPEEEADLVDVFESIDEPQSFSRPSPTELIASFEMLSGEPHQEMAPALHRFQPEQVLWYESDETGEVDAYYCYRQGEFEFFYTPQSLDDEDDDQLYNQNISPQLQSALEGMSTGAAILYLGRRLSYCEELMPG